MFDETAFFGNYGVSYFLSRTGQNRTDRLRRRKWASLTTSLNIAENCKYASFPKE